MPENKENRVIDEDKFNNQFGYRVKNLSNSQEIKEHILKNKKYYLDTLIDRLK